MSSNNNDSNQSTESENKNLTTTQPAEKSKKCSVSDINNKISSFGSFGLLILVFIVSFVASLIGEEISSIRNRSSINKSIAAQNGNTYENIEPFVVDAIINNPEKIIESVSNYQKELTQQQQQEAAQNLPKYIDELAKLDSSYIGMQSGSKVIYKFVDANCGYCKKAHTVMDKLIKNDPEIKVMTLHLPILGEGSIVTAGVLYALYLDSPELYEKAYNQVMDGPRISNLNDLKKSLARVNINNVDDIIERSKSNDKIQRHLTNIKNIARNLGINGTPAFIVNNKLVPGFISYDQFTKILNEK